MDIISLKFSRKRALSGPHAILCAACLPRGVGAEMVMGGPALMYAADALRAYDQFASPAKSDDI